MLYRALSDRISSICFAVDTSRLKKQLGESLFAVADGLTVHFKDITKLDPGRGALRPQQQQIGPQSPPFTLPLAFMPRTGRISCT